MLFALILLNLFPQARPLSEVQLLRQQLKTQLEPILNSKPLSAAKVGVLVVRLEDGTELYKQKPDDLFIPASTVKIVTTAAALSGLPGNYQFPTEVYGNTIVKNTLEGDLYVKGYGDPYLIPERLWALANRLYYLGLRELKGDIVIDDSYFNGDRETIGREQDLTSSAYNAPAGAVSAAFNALHIYVTPSDKVGKNASIAFEPASDYATVDGHIETVDQGKTQFDIQVIPQNHHSIVQISGKILQSDGIRAVWRRIDNPPMYAGKILKRLLQQLGVKIRGDVREGLLPLELPKLTEILSPSLGELLGPLNKHSNNFMAMQLAFALGAERFGAPGSWEKGQQAIREFLKYQVGIPPENYLLGNASGLHDVNRFSPRQIVQVLRYMSTQTHIWPEFLASFAMPGGPGTLHDRLRETDIANKVRAKTGSLSKISALAGYVTSQSGQTLAFAFFVNDYKADHADIIEAQDKVAATLARLQLSNKTARIEKP